MTERTITIEEYRGWIEEAKAAVAAWAASGQPTLGYHACGVSVSAGSFHQGTAASFELCDIPAGEPDHQSGGDSGSCYWYRDGGVVRASDHWSGVECVLIGGSRCQWTISGERERGDYVAGFCRFDQMTETSSPVCRYDQVREAARLLAGVDDITWLRIAKASDQAAKAERKAAREAKSAAALAEARRAARSAKTERRMARLAAGLAA